MDEDILEEEVFLFFSVRYKNLINGIKTRDLEFFIKENNIDNIAD